MELNFKNPAVIIANEICNMLTNNVLEEQGVESFESWCENGSDDFFGDYEISEKKLKVVRELMTEVAPHVDAIGSLLKKKMPRHRL